MDLIKYVRTQWDRSGAVLSVVAGLLVLLLGWVGTSGTSHVAGQIPYVISAGLLGIFLLGLGAALWLSADLRDEWRELRELNGHLNRLDVDRSGGRAEAGAGARHRS
ncbi:hypothetical protein [Sporichthya polymorpha]|uniref:hypothetical protein n=1 Tax=Sporichthya polymorpha TaxID=35751 RepID=UPI000365C58C|nr:hypothetical protein [Sporichthya polymorpha]